MKIKYIGTRRREIATPRGITVDPGDVVEVGEKLGASLLQQTSKFTAAEEPPAPSNAEVRAWAAAEGIEVPSRGKAPDDVIAAYVAAQEAKESSA